MSSDEIDLEKVKLWFKCSVCHGYVFSIPELKRHAESEHKGVTLKLPENLPPGAENGKIYYEHPAGHGSVPSPFPYSKRSFIDTDPEPVKDENQSTLTEALPPLIPDSPEAVIKVRDIREIVEACSEEEKDNTLVSNEKSNDDDNGQEEGENSLPIASPPDSGIHDDVSETTDDEAPVPPHPPTQQPPSQPMSTTTTTSNESNKSAPATPSSSTDRNSSIQTKFPCDICKKCFHTQSHLNFHKAKQHEEREKILMTIRRSNENDDFIVSNLSFRNEQAACAAIDRAIESSRQDVAFEPPQSSTHSQQRNSSVDADSVNVSISPPSPTATLLIERSAPAPAPNCDDANDPSLSDIGSCNGMAPKGQCKRRVILSSADDETGSEGENQTKDNPKKRKKLKRRRPGGAGPDQSSEDDEPPPSKKNDICESDNSTLPPTLVPFDQDATLKMADSKFTSDTDDLFVPIGKVRKKKKKKRGKTSAKTKEEPGTSRQSRRMATTVCKHCGLECKSANDLIHHLEKWHMLQKKVKMVCGYCNKSYTQRQHFNRHIQIHLQQKQEEEAQKEVN